jgi:hypothetical protein
MVPAMMRSAEDGGPAGTRSRRARQRMWVISESAKVWARRLRRHRCASGRWRGAHWAD